MGIRFRHRSRSSNLSEGGPGVIVFGVFWTLFSSVFLVIGLFGVFSALRSEGWRKTPCVIERFEILDDQSEKNAFTADVRFRYSIDGREFTGTRLFSEEKRHSDHSELARLQARFLQWDIGSPEPGRFDPAGRAPRESNREMFCRVNPDNPEDAALIADRSSIIGGLVFACFGLGFVGVGVGLTITGVRAWRAKRGGGNASVTGRSSSAEQTPLAILFPFFTIFAVAGFGILFGVVAPMWWGWFRAKSWEEIPATVIWSRVETNTGSDSTTYMPRIYYRYEWNGRQFRSDRHRFSSMSSSGYDGKKAVVDAHPSGATVTCFVNPSAPWEAVLDRRLGAFAWFSLFPLPFILVGVIGLRWAIGQARERKAGAATGGRPRSSRARQTTGAPVTGPGLLEADTGPLELRSGARRKWEVLILLAITLFWNGIVSVFVVQMLREWQAGESPWFLTIFLTPFVVIGAGLGVMFLYKLVGLANPSPRLRIEPATPRLGQTVRVSWHFPNGSGPLTRLVIRVTACEKATTSNGDNSKTERSYFFNQTVVESSHPSKMSEGQATLALPAGLMHTWSSANNAIDWEIEINGDIPLRPNLADRHPLTILPAAVTDT